MAGKYKNEKVLVIRNDIIFKEGKWQGLNIDCQHYYNLIGENYEFVNREEAEESNEYQQVIPYIIFKHRDKFFLYEYLKGASELRLHHNYMLGVAGHINPTDGDKEDIIKEGMMKEWNEEVEYKGNIINKLLIGILNDERRDVERVHIGLIYIFEGDSPEIKVKEKHKMKGKLMTIEEMKPFIGNGKDFGWASLIYPYLEEYKGHLFI